MISGLKEILMGLFNRLFGREASAENCAGKAAEHFQRAEYDLAITQYSEAIRLGSNDVGVLLGRGQAYLETGDADRAMKDFEAAFKKDVKATQGHFFWRGQAWGERGDRAREIAEYDWALRVDPTFALGFAARANVFREQGEYSKALADYTEAIRLAPFMGEAYRGRAAVYRATGDRQRAEADQQKADALGNVG
jgi:tetratricopeptide (TPR) repeat protein